MMISRTESKWYFLGYRVILVLNHNLMCTLLTISLFNFRVEPNIIRAGVVELGGKSWNEQTDYRVVESIPHPSYKHSSKYHDIALLR